MENEQKKISIDWDAMKPKNSEDRIKLEVGVKLELGFNSIKQEVIEVVDKEATEEGKVEVKKQLPVLVLGVDRLDGKPVKKELMVSSRKLIQVVRTYFEKNMLFNRIFQLEKSGSGFQTAYQLIALQDKTSA